MLVAAGWVAAWRDRSLLSAASRVTERPRERERAGCGCGNLLKCVAANVNEREIRGKERWLDWLLAGLRDEGEKKRKGLTGRWPAACYCGMLCYGCRTVRKKERKRWRE